jgi:hypothetical protein
MLCHSMAFPPSYSSSDGPGGPVDRAVGSSLATALSAGLVESRWVSGQLLDGTAKSPVSGLIGSMCRPLAVDAELAGRPLGSDREADGRDIRQDRWVGIFWVWKCQRQWSSTRKREPTS